MTKLIQKQQEWRPGFLMHEIWSIWSWVHISALPRMTYGTLKEDMFFSYFICFEFGYNLHVKTYINLKSILK